MRANVFAHSGNRGGTGVAILEGVAIDDETRQSFLVRVDGRRPSAGDGWAARRDPQTNICVFYWAGLYTSL